MPTVDVTGGGRSSAMSRRVSAMTFAIWNPCPRLFRARHREWQLYLETGQN
jgi:hypothetical protein